MLFPLTLDWMAACRAYGTIPAGRGHDGKDGDCCRFRAMPPFLSRHGGEGGRPRQADGLAKCEIEQGAFFYSH